jgi:two-component system sensor histidine kinase CiaH
VKLKKPSIIRFLRSTTARLAASYLGIIMVLSVGFSYVLYKTSAHELGREMPPPSMFDPDRPGFIGGQAFHHFFQRRIEEGRGHLLGRLVILNLVVLVIGAALSYYLARRTLQPIEDAMDAQSRFVTDASHELRTPLTAILAGNEVSLRKPNLTIKQAKDTIKSNTEEIIKLQALTDGLLSLAAQDTNGLLAVAPISLQDVAGEAMNRVLTAAQTKQISIEDSAPDIKVSGDQTKLVQLVSILLDNSIKYSPDKSIIYIEGHSKDNQGYLSVRDEGIGIAAEDLPHIFDRFYRADLSRNKPVADGYGIGLSIAKKIIEQHHGRITASSEPGKGATFTIELPLAPAAAKPQL